MIDILANFQSLLTQIEEELKNVNKLRKIEKNGKLHSYKQHGKDVLVIERKIAGKRRRTTLGLEDSETKEIIYRKMLAYEQYNKKQNFETLKMTETEILT